MLHTHELTEGYVLEIISRAQSVQRRCKELLSKDFASESPKNLANALINIINFLEEATKSIFKSIDWIKINQEKIKESFILLQITDIIIKELGSHVRYIDGAQTQKLPWSLIRPIEKIIRKLLPDAEIMLRPQWNYNYTIYTNNLYEDYLYYLSGYQNLFPAVNFSEILAPISKSFYVVSFPSIERKNILLHCLLGHEIGHLLSKNYFTKEREEDLLKSIRDRVVAIAEDLIKRELPPPLIIPQITQQYAQNTIKRTVFIWKRGLEEILADTIGSLIFGPAVLFSTLEFSLQNTDGLDTIPSEDNNYYPPWRTRLRNMVQVIKDLKVLPLPDDKFDSKEVLINVNKRFNLIEGIVIKTLDKMEIEKNAILKIAYEEIEKDIMKAREIYKNELKQSAVDPSDFFKYLPHLIKRLGYGIPPNAFEKTINERRPSTVVEIINAAWFHKLSWKDQLVDENGVFKNAVCENRDRMNRLTLKALDYSDIETEYFEKKESLGKT